MNPYNLKKYHNRCTITQHPLYSLYLVIPQHPSHRLIRGYPRHCPSIPATISTTVIPSIPAITSITATAPASQPSPLSQALPRHPSHRLCHPASTVTVEINNFSSPAKGLAYRMRWTRRDCPPGWGCRPVRRRAWSGISCFFSCHLTDLQLQSKFVLPTLMLATIRQR